MKKEVKKLVEVGFRLDGTLIISECVDNLSVSERAKIVTTLRQQWKV